MHAAGGSTRMAVEDASNIGERACGLLHCSNVLQGGGLLNHVAPCFSKDGTALYLACAEAVLAFCTTELKRLHTLQHEFKVTAVCLHPLCATQLYTACQDGTITLWNLSTLSVAKQWNLESPICSLQVQDDTGVKLRVLSPYARWHPLTLHCWSSLVEPQHVAPVVPAAYVSCHWRERRAGRLLAYNLAAHTAMSTRVKLSSASQLVVGGSGKGHVQGSQCLVEQPTVCSSLFLADFSRRAAVGKHQSPHRYCLAGNQLPAPSTDCDAHKASHVCSPVVSG
jgi:WD40 repeat protein